MVTSVPQQLNSKSSRWLYRLTLAAAASLTLIGTAFYGSIMSHQAEQSLKRRGFRIDIEHDPRNAFLDKILWGSRNGVLKVSGERSAELMGKPSEINDESLEPLRRLRRVEALYLGFQPITDEGLKQIEGLTDLKRLNVCGTQITDDGLRSLRRLTKLKELAIEFTEVTDEGTPTSTQIH